MNSALETARAIREGERTCDDVVRERLDRIDRLNPRVNAIITRVDERALQRARRLDEMAAAGEFAGPLHGVPFTIKDMFATEGIRTTYGMPNLMNHVPDHNAAMLDTLLDAGAVLLGKTNLPLGSHDWQSKHPRLGRCNNPWDLSRTVGGSSGGSAASLAAGFADLEVGSDVAGSIRVPAHYCGVVGLRPTEGVLSDEGHGDLPMARAPLPNLAVVGPMARCVDDVQAAFDVMRGEGAAASTRDAPAPSALRLAWSGQQGEFGLSSQTERILAKTRDALESSGADVHDASPGVDTDYAMRIWGRIHGYEMRQSMPAATGLPLVRHLTSWAWFRMRLGAGRIVDYMRDGFTGGEQQYARDLEARAELQDDLAAFFDEYDAWLLPSAPFPAFRHQRTGAPIEYDGRTVNYADSHAAYQCPVVVMENPVVSLPVGVTDGGLPVGIQIAGTRFEESALLEVAAAIESVRSAPFPEPGLD